MSKIIEITVTPRGETKVETRGFTGGECREASRFVEQALGARVERDAHRRPTISRPRREPPLTQSS